MEFRFKKSRYEAPATLHHGPSASQLAFIHIDNPEQIRDRKTQRRIRRHVMKDIGTTRRRGYRQLITTSLPYIPSIPQSLFPIPSYVGDIKVCLHYQRIFRALEVVDQEALSLALGEIAFDFSGHMGVDLETFRTKDFTDQLPMEAMRSYTNSLGAIRDTLKKPWHGSDRGCAISTVICLAFYDVRNSIIDFQPNDAR